MNELAGDWRDLAALSAPPPVEMRDAPGGPRAVRAKPEALDLPMPPGYQPNGPYRRLCMRCCSNADAAAKQGTPHPPLEMIPEVERYRSKMTGHWIYLSTCTHCTDYEFTVNWQRRFGEAQQAGKAEAIAKLQRERQGWLQRGRKFFG